LGVEENFFEMGGDSILNLQIVARAGKAGIRFTPRQLFQHQTVAELATVVTIEPNIEAEQGLVTGSLPLTPIQRRFFNHYFIEPHHFNQAILLRVNVEIDSSLLEKSLQALLCHHDALR